MENPSAKPTPAAKITGVGIFLFSCIFLARDSVAQRVHLCNVNQFTGWTVRNHAGAGGDSEETSSYPVQLRLEFIAAKAK